ncbi:ABC transporter ATP-binding protein [Tumebacillus sp. ITR2]|uniref:ABC transporter ATP-binding protein n=1 Tax=Tumebacillus amylolyticus TaxID=2801339 RepID=A0ABS1JA22_9BACL|nr:ABC transporter ATP-binding protein [Tumebacillus amylolyticus]MBL0387130.1 ABC transporter ATP-binding protein [Tumebacillus amylolyticus]
MTAISFEGVNQTYMTKSGETTALQEIWLDIQEGELIGLVGPSGCGKSTLLSLIAGLLKPTNGTVQLFGKKVAGPSPDCGYMFQQDYLLPWRTILDNVLIGPEITGTVTPALRQRALHLLDELGLSDTASKHPHQLSGGMRQRVALGRTLLTEPRVVLLDEPFSALDYQIKLQLEDLIAETLKARNLTGVLVTHDLGEAVAMCDRIVVLSNRPGRIKRVLEVPHSIRELSPLEARENAEFHNLFRMIWGDLQDEY